MLNYSSEFYFNYNFGFYNSNHQFIISPKEARKNSKTIRNIEKQKNNFDLVLYPEGGKIISGQLTIIYYKAVNTFGDRTGVDLKLIQMGSDSILLALHSDNGIGDFSFYPGVDKKYRIEATFSNHKTKTYTLPEVKTEGVWGQLETTADSIKLKLSKPNRISADPSANRYYIILHTNDFIGQVIVADLRKDTTLSFNKSSLSPGIINFSVLSNRLHHEANFKTFIAPVNGEANAVTIKETADSLFYVFDTSLLSNFKSASLSVIETDSDKFILPDFYNEFYLNSDLVGWYTINKNLSEGTDNKEICRFINTMENKVPDWNAVFNPAREDFAVNKEDGIVVAGKILTELLAMPVKNANVRLEVMSRYNDIFETTADNNGYFIFSGFDFYDTLQMKIIARKPSGKKNVLIELRSDPIPEVSEYNGDFFLTTKSLRNKKAYNKQINIKASEEARRKDRELEEFYMGKIHGRPDNIIYGSELPQNTSVLEALHGRVPGMNITGDQILIRGRNTILGNTDPLVLIDDIPSDVSILKNISTTEVERIEILKGPSASIYGVRGGNGVISVRTKTGMYMKHGEIDITLVGYQKPGVFKYGNKPKETENLIPKTVIWVPEMNRDNINGSSAKCIKPSANKVLQMCFLGIDKSGSPIFQKNAYPLK
jgi:TonB-dependent SusC/RagA subfamily outer membrane receptor